VFVDTTDELAEESVARSEFGFGRALMLMRRAITEVFESSDRGPGIYYAHPGFEAQNAVFGATSFLHEGFKAPTNDSHPVRDAALQARFDSFNRLRYIGELGYLSALIRTATSFAFDDLKDLARERAQALLDREPVEGWPSSLRNALTALVNDFTASNSSEAQTEIDREFWQLHRARMASFLHPNEVGAQRYTDTIGHLYRRHRKRSIKAELRGLADHPASSGAATLSVGQTLRRYGLDPATGLRACLQHTIIDSLAVETVTGRPVEPLLSAIRPSPVTVRVDSGVEWTVQNPIAPFTERGATDVFCYDPLGKLLLQQIKRFEIELPSSFDGGLASFSLLLNGKRVFSAASSEARRDGNRWSFNYPG
jgi:hypothetical protein